MQTASIISGIIYLVAIVFTVVRILLDTHSTPKTLGYLMLVIFLPVIGILFYYSFGINYRHLSSINKGIIAQRELDTQISNDLNDDTSPLSMNKKKT